MMARVSIVAIIPLNSLEKIATKTSQSWKTRSASNCLKSIFENKKRRGMIQIGLI